MLEHRLLIVSQQIQTGGWKTCYKEVAKRLVITCSLLCNSLKKYFHVLNITHIIYSVNTLFISFVYTIVDSTIYTTNLYTMMYTCTR